MYVKSNQVKGEEEWGILQVCKRKITIIITTIFAPVHYFYIFAFSFSLLPVNMKIMSLTSYLHQFCSQWNLFQVKLYFCFFYPFSFFSSYFSFKKI